jgi:hypothetical protein
MLNRLVTILNYFEKLPGETGSSFYQRIVFITSQSESVLDNAARPFQLGSNFRSVTASKPDQKAILKRALQGYGMPDPSVRMVQSIYVISLLTGSPAFARAGATRLPIDARKMYKKANIFCEIRDAFFDGDIAVRKVFSDSNRFLKSVGQECFNEVVNDVFKKPLDNRQLEDPALREACARLKLAVTKPCKKQLETLHYMMQLQGRDMTFLSIFLV